MKKDEKINLICNMATKIYCAEFPNAMDAAKEDVEADLLNGLVDDCVETAAQIYNNAEESCEK